MPDASTTETAAMAVGLALLPTSPPIKVIAMLLALPAPHTDLALPDVSTPYTAPNASVVIELSSDMPSPRINTFSGSSNRRVPSPSRTTV
jgi:hypothetical protein